MPWNAMSRREVFVIDDDARTREALSNGLQEKGYDVISFADGDAQVRAFKAMQRKPCLFQHRPGVDAHGSGNLRVVRQAGAAD